LVRAKSSLNRNSFHFEVLLFRRKGKSKNILLNFYFLGKGRI
jgi:hypothetical protein